MHEHYHDQPLLPSQEKTSAIESNERGEKSNEIGIADDKIIITEQCANDQQNRIVVMEEEELPLEITETNQSTNKSHKRSSSISLSDFRCICNEPFFDSFSSADLIQCSKCAILQHAHCVRTTLERTSPFLCNKCIVFSPIQPNLISATPEGSSPDIYGEIIVDKASPSSELVRSPASFVIPPAIRSSLPLLLPAIKNQNFSSGSSLIIPKSTEVPFASIASFQKVSPSLPPPSSKRGRKPKALKQQVSIESSLVPVLLSKETLPLSFSEPIVVERTTSSISYIPADHLRISNDARSLIRHAWRVFYASALSKRITDHKAHDDIPAVLTSVFGLISNDVERTKSGSILNFLLREYFLNCSFWSFGVDERPRSLRLFTREFRAPTIGNKSIGVFLTEDEHANLSTPLLPGSFITMLTGTLLTRPALAEEFGSSEEEKMPLQVPQSFMFFHPTLPLVVDARKTGNMARFIRRSCRPNVAIRGIFVTGGSNPSCHVEEFAEERPDMDEADPDSLTIATFSIGIFSTDRIRPGIDELLLPCDNNEFCSAPCSGPHTGPGRSCLDPSSSIQSGAFDEAMNILSLPPPPAITTSSSSLSITKESPHTPSSGGGLSSSSSSSSASSLRHNRPKVSKKKTTILSPASPLSPTSSTVNTLSLSREERKLQMYIESIQRLEQREKRKGQR